MRGEGLWRINWIHGQHKPELRSSSHIGRHLDLPSHLLTQLLADRQTNLSRFLGVYLLRLEIHILKGFKVTLKQVEYIWKLLRSYADSRIFNFKFDKLLTQQPCGKRLFFELGS